MRSSLPSILLVTPISPIILSTALSNQSPARMRRETFLSYAAAAISSAPVPVLLNAELADAFAFAPKGSDGFTRTNLNGANDENDSMSSKPLVAYRSLAMDMPGYNVDVPIAMWYPVTREVNKEKTPEGESESNPEPRSSPGQTIIEYPELLNPSNLVMDQSSSGETTAVYSHRISVKKIGQLLAGWDWIPDFASRDFSLTPTMNQMVSNSGKTVAEFVVDGLNIPLPSRGPVIFLAHGYLGSRFDLSHLAEQLAKEGFICISPEYPESLASSYPRLDGLNREIITKRLMDIVESDLSITPTSRGIIGHSLGCGTAISTGDNTWTRVCIAGLPSTVDGPALFLSSVNDGAISLSRVRGSMVGYVELDENAVRGRADLSLPQRAALIFDRDDAPNHISFLADSTNDAMIALLSPLLPVAQALSIPVLDFDKYQISRDSKQTADVVVPLVTSFLKQNMQ